MPKTGATPRGADPAFAVSSDQPVFSPSINHASATTPAVNTVSPMTRSHRSVWSAGVCRNSAERAYHIPGRALAVAIALSAVTFVAISLTIRRKGLAVLRFVTLVPVIVSVAFLLRVVAPRMDAALSMRPMAQELATMDTGKSEVAVFRASRNVEYGLAFYRNHIVYRYERDEVPAEGHIVVAPEGSIDAIREKVPGRRVRPFLPGRRIDTLPGVVIT